MFRKRATKTYERRRPGTHSASSIASTIIREDVPPDRNVRSKELSDVESGDDTMDDDPFDTTFDRLLKTAKMPPKPPSPGGNSSYAGSSSDEEANKDDLQGPLPPIVDEPVTKRQRFVKRERAVKKDPTVVSGHIKRRPGRRAEVKSIANENTEPNIEQSAITRGTKRGGNRTAGSRAETVKKQTIAKRTSIASRRGRRPNDNACLPRCNVVLTRLEFPDESTVSENLPSDPSMTGNSTEKEDVAASRSSEVREASVDRFPTDEGTSADELRDKPTSSVETSPIAGTSKRSELSTNPTLRLMRLSVPQQFSIAEKSWINSTPIDRPIRGRRRIMNTPRLRLSPIDARASTRVGRGDVKSTRASLSPKSPVEDTKSVHTESASPKNSQPSSEADLNEKSSEEDLGEKSSVEDLGEKSSVEDLGEKSSVEDLCEKSSSADLNEKSSEDDLGEKSSAADFNEKSSGADIDEKSIAAGVDEKSTESDLVKKSSATNFHEQPSERQAILSMESSASEPPLFDDSGSLNERSEAETSSIGKEKFKDMTDSSRTSPLKGFAPDSSDPESLQLRYEASDASLVSEEIHEVTVNNASTIVEELMKDWSDGESADSQNFNDDENEESSSKNFDRSNENEQPISHSTAPSENTADITDAPTSEQTGGFTDVSMNSPPNSSTDVLEKIDSDDEWSTVLGSSVSNADLSVNKNISANSSTESSDWLRRQIIEQLSSGEDGSSSDDMSRLVNANGASADESETETGSARRDSDDYSNEKRSILEDISGNDSKEEREEESNEGVRRYLRRPVVLLTRLVLSERKAHQLTVSEKTESTNLESTPSRETIIPARKSRKISKVEDTIAAHSSGARKSNEDSISNSDYDRASIAKPGPVRKSRRLSKVEESNAPHSSDVRNLNKNSIPSSVDDRGSIAKPVIARKSRRSSKAEIASAAHPSHAIESSQNSTLSSVDNSGPDVDAPIPARKSKRPSKVEKTVDARFSEIQAPSFAKKLPKFMIAKTVGEKEASDLLESSGKPSPSGDSRTKRSLDADEEPEVDERKSLSKRRPTTEERNIDSHKDIVDPIVLLTRLNDPVRVSLRRQQKYSYMSRQLSAIAENAESSPPPTIEEAHEDNAVTESSRSTLNTRRTSVKLSGEESCSQRTTVSVNSSISSRTLNESRIDEREDKRLFLIPGKSWARSLSILSNVHSQDDVEALATGKGKRWRQSVANILQMQRGLKGLLQSCVKKNEDDKESRSFYGVRNSTAAWNAGSSQPDTSRMLGAASPDRFVRRVSIRVVPDGKSLDHIEDSPFLEAYGITSSRNSQTINKRSASIVPRKTLVYNVQEVAYDEIPRGVSSATSRDVVLKQCGQTTSLPFDECYPLSYLKHCRKIGEGVYGEVFLYENGDEKNVIKIIPIEGEMDVNNERQKKFDEILSEIVIAKELHNLRFADSSSTSSFVEVKNIRCVIGRYPRKLIELWKTYDDEKNSENDCPVMFDENQLYIVLELGHGGQDLEAFVFQNASESYALFMQAAVALAVAEEKLDFEHRDLHWGNILISRTEDSHVDYKLRDKAIKLVSKGVKVSVIDFTLSRMSYQGCSIYNDLSLDEDLFSAQGEYQFEIYRLMRKKVENDWQRFEPYTNVLWLHYTLDKMITAVRYRRKNSKIHNTSIEKLRELHDTILNYKSAFDFVTNCDKIVRLQGSRTSVAAVG